MLNRKNKQKPKKQQIKPQDVKILSFDAVLVPTATGSFTQFLWGLGDDDRMYLWASENNHWVLG